ncbi:hypothetical protein AAFF_G00046460 [Aldrovandia affinis]|uniref:Uncharacterized protein n=1 Tax=Aldrovandia affinis TaxID=143900 RepID=A0AAD7S1V4_9TELE|nr:hypothetical protein AAFF_G00046460 [Aldrovandia affinis]
MCTSVLDAQRLPRKPTDGSWSAPAACHAHTTMAPERLQKWLLRYSGRRGGLSFYCLITAGARGAPLRSCDGLLPPRTRSRALTGPEPELFRCLNFRGTTAALPGNRTRYPYPNTATPGCTSLLGGVSVRRIPLCAQYASPANGIILPTWCGRSQGSGVILGMGTEGVIPSGDDSALALCSRSRSSLLVMPTV